MSTSSSAGSRGIARLAAISALAVSSFGCAAIPPPRIVAEADEVAASKRAVEAKSLAPSAFAHAEKLRSEAHAALLHDRAAHAQMLAEQAIAAYEEASALARVARAQRAEQVALSEADKSDAELATVEAELTRARAEADALETRLKVTRDAQPITASGPASAGREEARKQAAHAMATQAKLLCTAAKLLGPVPSAPKADAPKADAPKADAPKADVAKADADKVPGGVDPTTPESIARDLASAEADLDKLDASLAGTGPVPIDLATRVRARCMSSLTHVRRANATTQKAPGAGDALLQELAAYASRDGSGLNPGRDERGVSVTLSRAFDGESLSSGATAKLADLDRVAASHPDFAVAVVLHSDKPLTKADEERWKARADKLSAAFKSVSKGRLSTLVAGNYSPLVDPHGKDKAKNLRVEIVFVSPESL